MSLSAREQLYAFLALIAAILILGSSPVIVAGILGKTLPDSLIAVSDKTVTGLVGVLGTIAAMIFRTNRTDEARAENTGKALDAITAAQNSPAPGTPQPVTVVNAPDQPVPTTDQPLDLTNPLPPEKTS